MLAALAALALFASCAQAHPPAPQVVNGAPHWVLDLVQGPAYHQTAKFLVFNIPLYPQVACWIETEDGTYVDTVYVTSKVARKSWYAAPSSGRPEALPVWSHARNQSPVIDSITGATPAGGVHREALIASDAKSGVYIVKLEVNISYDYNERYTRSNSGVNGQPSVVYSGKLKLGGGQSDAVLAPLGTGSVDGSDGGITLGTQGITTALDLVTSAKISFYAR